MATSPPAVQHMAAHVLAELQVHRSKIPSAHRRPLFIALQGPQGSGKTFLTRHLQAALTSSPHSLHVAVLSLDDLYLPHAGLASLAKSYPDNKLFAGRGLPGTHDVTLGSQVLDALKQINESDSSPQPKQVELPIFEKSLYDGEGDRLPSGFIVTAPLDIVIFEGWCAGFCPTSEASIRERYALPTTASDIKDMFDINEFSVEGILEVNKRLWEYVNWWATFDVFIQIKPPSHSPLAYIYRWRLQQEHHMKAQNGGKGMTDEQVKTFIDRYIPGYIFFSEGIQQGYVKESEAESGHEGIEERRVLPAWRGRSLAITIDGNRNVLGMENF